MNKQNQDNDNSLLFIVLAIVGAGAVGTHKAAITVWFYENLMWLVLGVFGLVALGVLYLLHKTKMKHERELERARALRAVKPQYRSINNYYDRRNH